MHVSALKEVVVWTHRTIFRVGYHFSVYRDSRGIRVKSLATSGDLVRIGSAAEESSERGVMTGTNTLSGEEVVGPSWSGDRLAHQHCQSNGEGGGSSSSHGWIDGRQVVDRQGSASCEWEERGLMD
jgi:hypothetical protein